MATKLPKGYKRRSIKPGYGTRRRNARNRNAGIRAVQAKFKEFGIRSLTRDEHEFLKRYEEEKAREKRTKLPTFKQRKSSYLEDRKEKRFRQEFLRHEAPELIEYVDSFRNDTELEDHEREELFDEFIQEWGIDLDEWIEIAESEGYSEHEAYEFWFYP